MIEKGNNNSQYSAADIQLYLTGKLPAEQMHAMEKAALDDPFLADAMDGMETALKQQGKAGLQDDFTELKQRLADRIADDKKTIVLTGKNNWWKIAASVIIIAGLGIVGYNSFRNPSVSSKDIAVRKEEPATIKADTVAQNQNIVLPQKDTIIKQDLAISYKKAVAKSPGRAADQVALTEQNNNGKTNTQESVRRDMASVSRPDATVAKSAPVQSNETFLEQDKIKTASPLPGTVDQRQVSDSFTTKMAALQIQSNYFSGKVIDRKNNPVSNATVLLNNSNNTVVTDKNGFFKLNYIQPDSILSLKVNAVGYTPVDVILNNNYRSNRDNIIQLKETASSLNEVVVTGYGGNKKRAVDSTYDADDSENNNVLGFSTKQKATIQDAVPATGWTEYNNYLDIHKKIPPAELNHKEYEVISFKVNKKGEFFSFIVEKSISAAHDAEAIKLVKEGPPWKLLKGKTARATLIITY